MEFIDTHTHIYDAAYEGDRGEVLARADEAGVGRLVAVGAGLESSGAALQMALAHPHIIATAGVHPHEAKDFDDAQRVEIRDMAAHPKVRAIGEIGLDYHYDFSPRPAQRSCFEAQLALAKDLALPVVIHMREAEEDVHAMLKEAIAAGVGPVEMHCFLGGPDEAARWLDLGCALGLGGALTFKKMESLREAARAIPLDRILLETDCPYMTPHPHRGQRNEPSYIPLVAQKLAEVKGLSLEEIAHATTENARAFFGAW